MACTNKLYVTRGDDVSLSISFTDVNNDPVDITGSTVYFTIKESLNDNDSQALVLIEQSTHVNPTQGETVIEVSSSQTNLLEVRNYDYALQIKYSNNEINSVQSGVIIVSQKGRTI